MEDRPIQFFPSNYIQLLLSFSLVLLEEMDILVGFRFRPTDAEIIHLLIKKRSDPDFSVHTIKEMDIYSCEPWELLRHSEIQSAEQEGYFFCEHHYKYAKSKRAHRRTTAGYWKITGSGSIIRAKNSIDVIGKKRILSFHHHGLASKGGKSEWVMHEFHIKDSPLYKKDFVICCIKRKQNNKHVIATRDEGQSSQRLVSDSEKNVAESNLLKSAFSLRQNLACGAENIFSESQLPPSDNLNSVSGNDVTQNSFLDAQLLSADHWTSNSGNHGAGNAFLDLQLLQNETMISHSKNHEVKTASPELQLVSSPNSISYRNDDAKSDSLESQVLPKHNVIPSFKIDFAENTYAGSQLPPSHNSISKRNDVAKDHSPEYLSNLSLVAPENTFPAKSLQLPEFDELNGYSGLTGVSFSVKQSQISAQQESPYSSSSSNGCFLNSDFCTEQVNDLIYSQRAFQSEYSFEETGQTLIPVFSSSKSDGGGYIDDSSDMDTETFVEWVKQQFAA